VAVQRSVTKETGIGMMPSAAGRGSFHRIYAIIASKRFPVTACHGLPCTDIGKYVLVIGYTPQGIL
jgi:hypothetical protein